MCDEIVSAKAIFYYYQLSYKFRDVYEDAIGGTEEILRLV